MWRESVAKEVAKEVAGERGGGAHLDDAGGLRRQRVGRRVEDAGDNDYEEHRKANLTVLIVKAASAECV